MTPEELEKQYGKLLKATTEWLDKEIETSGYKCEHQFINDWDVNKQVCSRCGIKRPYQSRPIPDWIRERFKSIWNSVIIKTEKHKDE